MKHITITIPASKEEAKSVSESVGAGHETYCVHPKAGSMQGRRAMASALRLAGCSPEVVRELGWATTQPVAAKPAGATMTTAEVREAVKVLEENAVPPNDDGTIDVPTMETANDDDGNPIPPSDAPNTPPRGKARRPNRNRDS